ncbi:MAG TPA: acyl-CoA dehydrogenase family protein [Phenylobacterium sp.]|uniref:acyl-CoA dehydrogenase family protein n=1 Tax=Phenylobacterium sp. TaxID=1871053 RepID=UPI002B48B83F|nr:acyl-CoA dehydrogenase family protein [Phenylobacterium sp.]HKR87104.1 acyl-CoA dehydrogenase family protein [Phenylobacterium sp.]
METVSELAKSPGDAEPTFETVLAEVRARSGEFEQKKCVPRDMVDKFRQIGIYRALVSPQFGGDGKSPADFCRMVEEISTADGSAGWVASFGAAATYLASLPTQILREVYADGPDVVFAGGLFPPQEAKRTAEGLRVSGRWQFGSGSPGADLIGVGVFVKDDETGGLPRMAVMPASKVTIRENWDVIGMRGTGSHDLIVEDVLVPESWTFIRGGPASLDEPINRYPAMALAAQVLAVVGLGVARAAIDELTGRLGDKVSIAGGAKLTDRPQVQIDVAKAEMRLRAARSWFYEATEEVWAEAHADRPVGLRTTTVLRLAAINAAHEAAQVVESMFRLAGTSGIYSAHPLSRQLCDALVVGQHAFLSMGHCQTAGRILMGGEGQPGFP